MGATPRTLPALEVSVRSRGTALASAQEVGVHTKAHRAAGVPPLETRLLENEVEALSIPEQTLDLFAGDAYQTYP